MSEGSVPPRSKDVIKAEIRSLLEEFLKANEEDRMDPEEYLKDNPDDEERAPAETIPMLLTKWILVCHQTGFDSKGNAFSGYPYVFSDDGLAPHDAYGLLMWHAEYVATAL